MSTGCRYSPVSSWSAPSPSKVSDLTIRQAEDGTLRVGDIDLPRCGEPETGAPAGKTWHVGVYRLDIRDTTIEYQQPDLAVQRAAAVTDYLVEQHGVSASRLVACQPAIDSTPDGKGRVDLLI